MKCCYFATTFFKKSISINELDKRLWVVSFVDFPCGHYRVLWFLFFRPFLWFKWRSKAFRWMNFWVGKCIFKWKEISKRQLKRLNIDVYGFDINETKKIKFLHKTRLKWANAQEKHEWQNDLEGSQSLKIKYVKWMKHFPRIWVDTNKTYKCICMYPFRKCQDYKWQQLDSQLWHFSKTCPCVSIHTHTKT